ncbi:MAG: DUF1631 family protein [Gammaproteobacteria bacterium]|nr:MAG: DUF1631 family protein [Gammaproteobacteria bacterium]
MKEHQHDPLRGLIPPASLKAAEMLIKRLLIEDEGPLPPLFLSSFLSCCWHRHLARQHAIHGPGSERWQMLILVTGRLLWSMGPRPDEKERRLLRQVAEELAPFLKEALDGCQHVHTESFVKHIAEWHIAIMRTGEPPEHSPAHRNLLEGTVPMLLMAPEYERYLDSFSSSDVEAVELKEPTIGDLRASLETTHG